MNKHLVILVAERNPHIRSLARRELKARKRRVVTVKNMAQLDDWLCRHPAPDILVLDPDLPGAENGKLSQLMARIPRLPVILHCLSIQSLNSTDRGKTAAGTMPMLRIVKSDDSMAQLREQINIWAGRQISCRKPV